MPHGRTARTFLAASIFALSSLGTVLLTACSQGDVEAALATQELIHIEGLGSLSFANSGAAGAQEAFHRGVLLLHSFEYGPAGAAFREAQEIDPDFALAYWGEAMSYTHAVWNEKDKAAALEALSRYALTSEERAAKAPTERERAYLEAVDLLYGEGQKAARDTVYSRAMARLAEAYPDDFEARAFHALSLLGLSQGDRDVPTYVRAGAIALELLESNGDHPGAAHYVIHAFDDPTHAPLGLRAARAYSEIAANAPHAQHMTTHIFLAMGMWDDVVDANVRADGVVDRRREAGGQPTTDCGHYNEWLGYGYQQKGRYSDAERLVMGCYSIATDDDLAEGARSAAASSFAFMRSLYLADTGVGDGPVAEAAPSMMGGTGSVPPMVFGDGLAAIARGDVAAAERALASLGGLGQPDDEWLSPYVPVLTGTLQALIRSARGDNEGALRAAREAADYEAALPFQYGPPSSMKPPRELEGELLLEMGRAEEALSVLDLALARTPRRALTLAVRARAAVAAGRDGLAADSYQILAEALHEADPNTPLLKEARDYLSSAGRGEG